MNTATRVLGADSLIQRASPISLNVGQFWLIILTALLFVSAFGIIYAKDTNRRLYIQAQLLERQNEITTERWSKLLLEQSTLTTQPRIERLAKKRLGMELPQSNTMQLVRSEKLLESNG